jgi:hypothetical protein
VLNALLDRSTCARLRKTLTLAMLMLANKPQLPY